jgi:membrane protein YqaA with SNARE-associated domain
MRSFSRWVLSLFLSLPGIVVLAALDSTLFFSLPFGIDAVVIILSARLRELAWLAPLLATGGSIAGAWLTFWMGVKVGERGLDRFVPTKRLQRIRARIRRGGAVALAVLDLVPPPFPFTAFVLAAGALEVNPATFFTTLVVCRLFRFGVEAALGALYGPSIVGWLDSDLFHDIASAFILLAIALTAVSTVKLLRSTRTSGRRAARRARA